MNAPASLRAPLRRAIISSAALVEAFASLAEEGIAPDLRGNAYGLGITSVSKLARDAGHSVAMMSSADIESSVLKPSDSLEEASAAWLEHTRPVITVEADVVSLKRVPAGTPVSYGYQYRTKQETTLALVSAGFADGVPRTASMKGQVVIQGSAHPIAGRIAMDQMVVDIGDTVAQIGDVATVWGENPTLSQWSGWSDRPAALLVSQLAPRVVRVWT